MNVELELHNKLIFNDNLLCIYCDLFHKKGIIFYNFEPWSLTKTTLVSEIQQVTIKIIFD